MSGWGELSNNQPTQEWGAADPFSSSSSNTNPPQGNSNASGSSWGNPAETSGGWGAATSSESTDNNWSSLAHQMESTSISNNQHQPGANDGFQQDASFSDQTPEYEVPTPKISIEEAWPEFLAADKTRDLDEVKPALAKLCEAYLGGEWQAVEKKLRDEKCNTYLLAMEDTLSFGYTLVNLKYQPDQRYRVIPSFIKPGSVKKGRMAIGMARNYEENFARLLEGGVVRSSGVLKCHNCRQVGHRSSECPEEKREPEKSEYFGKCYNCGSEDHRTRTCPEPRKVLTCRNCNGEGHMARDCPEPPAPMTCNRCGEEGHTSRDCDQPRTDITCNRCNQPGHMSRDCSEPRTDITCNRCNQPGHMARECSEPRTDITCNRCNQTGHMARDCSEPRTDITCNRCGEVGHMSRDCGQPRTDITCFNCDEVGHASRDCEQPRREKCHRCNQPGHMSYDCPNEGSTDFVQRRPPPRTNRFGFSEGF
ncbi:hypothetical protein BGZ72_006072 [Mortierella alpina]|nr:hypothetical protein BGZ72_006072 [Mortierella alpina]